MLENHSKKLTPEPNSEADVRAYYLLERNDAEIFYTLSPKQIQAIANTWDFIEDLALPQIEDFELRTELHMALCDTTTRIIDGTTTLNTLLERKRHTSPGTPDYIKADVYIKTARFALDLLKIKRGTYTTPRRQNHYDPKGY
jgi:hypothetical protein